MKEHLEYSTAEDVDDLIAAIHDLNGRLDRLREEVLSDQINDSVRDTGKRSLRRLLDKRDGLLRALNDALGYIRNE